MDELAIRVFNAIRLALYKHKLPASHRVESTAVLGGLHHEYRVEKAAA